MSLRVKADGKGERRPAWLKINSSQKENYPEMKFATFEGKSETTHYKLLVGNYYLPINPTSEEEKIFFEHVASEYDSIQHSEHELGRFAAFKLSKHGIAQHSKVLDLYAGTGMVSEELAKAGFTNLSLLDFSGKMLEEARKKPLLKKAVFLLQDFLRRIPGEKFDAVVCVMGMHYHEGADLRRFIGHVKKILSQNGIFICIQPTAPNEICKYLEVLERGKLKFNNQGYVSKLPFFVARNKRK